MLLLCGSRDENNWRSWKKLSVRGFVVKLGGQREAAGVCVVWHRCASSGRDKRSPVSSLAEAPSTRWLTLVSAVHLNVR